MGTGGAGAGADRDDKEVDGGVDEEGDGREREQERSVTIEDVASLAREASVVMTLETITKMIKDQTDGTEELRKEMKSMNDSMRASDVASDPGERDEEVEESDGDAHDHLIEFADRLESGMRCFQRQVQATDRKVQETRWKATTSPKSPRKKRRRKK